MKKINKLEELVFLLNEGDINKSEFEKLKKEIIFDSLEGSIEWPTKDLNAEKNGGGAIAGFHCLKRRTILNLYGVKEQFEDHRLLYDAIEVVAEEKENFYIYAPDGVYRDFSTFQIDQEL